MIIQQKMYNNKWFNVLKRELKYLISIESKVKYYDYMQIHLLIKPKNTDWSWKDISQSCIKGFKNRLIDGYVNYLHIQTNKYYVLKAIS